MEVILIRRGDPSVGLDCEALEAAKSTKFSDAVLLMQQWFEGQLPTGELWIYDQYHSLKRLHSVPTVSTARDLLAMTDEELCDWIDATTKEEERAQQQYEEELAKFNAILKAAAELQAQELARQSKPSPPPPPPPAPLPAPLPASCTSPPRAPPAAKPPQHTRALMSTSQTALYVRNLPHSTTVEGLTAIFAAQKCCVIHSSIATLFTPASVELDSVEACIRAISTLNGAIWKGRKLEVGWIASSS